MLLVNKEHFEEWSREHKWLLIAEIPISTGHHHLYLTPAGNFVVAIYNSEGKLADLGSPMAVPVPNVRLKL
jgi:hypothetical protein